MWAIIGCGVALACLRWRLHASLGTQLDPIDAELTNIEERLECLELRVDSLISHLSKGGCYGSTRLGPKHPLFVEISWTEERVRNAGDGDPVEAEGPPDDWNASVHAGT